MSSPEQSCPIHSSMEPFSRLIGDWEGQGSMYLYTSTAYPCEESISIGHIGQPSFWYRSRAYSGGAYRHCDLGFIFFNEKTGQLNFMSSDNTGHVHIMIGSAKHEDGKIEIVLETKLVDGHPLSMKPKMLKVRREISLIDDNTITQKVFMATEKVNELRIHTNVTYKRSNNNTGLLH